MNLGAGTHGALSPIVISLSNFRHRGLSQVLEIARVSHAAVSHVAAPALVRHPCDSATVSLSHPQTPEIEDRADRLEIRGRGKLPRAQDLL